jgi:TPR repeat protein
MQHREALKAYKAKDYETAMKLWEEESKFKNDQAMTNIGLMYLKGEGVEKDYIKAKEWFEKASEYDNSSANYNLGLLYQNGIGIEADGEKAIYYLRKAVSKNHQGANFRLGLELSKDKTDLEKLKEGFTALLNAAKSGHPMAAMQISGVDKPSSSENLNEEFRSKNKEEQLEVINSIMDIHIRPMLMQDGGNILLLNYLNEPEIEMHFVYQGNCSGCALASTSTYDLIFNTLTKLIDNNIKVYIL